MVNQCFGRISLTSQVLCALCMGPIFWKCWLTWLTVNSCKADLEMSYTKAEKNEHFRKLFKKLKWSVEICASLVMLHVQMYKGKFSLSSILSRWTWKTMKMQLYQLISIGSGGRSGIRLGEHGMV